MMKKKLLLLHNSELFLCFLQLALESLDFVIVLFPLTVQITQRLDPIDESPGYATKLLLVSFANPTQTLNLSFQFTVRKTNL